MTHDQIERGELAELYVRGRLNDADRAAFEEHYFGCDACFEEVQRLEQFIAGVREMDLESIPEPAPVPAPVIAMPVWRQPVFYGAMAACLAMGVLTGWALLVDRARLTQEVADARRVSGEAATRLQMAERELAMRRAAAAAPAPSLAASLPLLMLEATRADEAPSIQVPPGSTTLALWLEPSPAADTTRYRLEVLHGNDVVVTIPALRRNSYGALAVSVPAEKLTAGTYRARLYVEQPKPVLAGDYRFEVRR